METPAVREPRVGDIVGIVSRSKAVIVLVISHAGKPDDLALYLDRTCKPYLFGIDACRLPDVPFRTKPSYRAPLLTSEEAEAARYQLHTAATSKRGREVIVKARARRVRRDEMTPDASGPSPGRGKPEAYDMPLKLARGFTSELSPDMVNYLMFVEEYRRRFLALAMRHDNLPELHYVLGRRLSLKT